MQSRGPLVVTVIVAIAIGYFAYSGYLGKHQGVYLVNGLERDYTVSLNGEKHLLKSRTLLSTDISQGVVKLSVEGEGLNIPDKDLTIANSFWSRPFSKNTYVINPDKTALIIWQSMVYTTKTPATEKETPYKIHFGKDLHVFTNIDYEFKEFPETITIDSSSSQVTRDGLQFIEGYTSSWAQQFLAESEGDEAATKYLLLYVEADPSHPFMPYMLNSVLEEEEFSELLEKYTAARPALVEWHRFYQTHTDLEHPEHDLEAEYSEYLKAEPDNQILMYLLGRVMKDLKAGNEMFEKAVSGQKPYTYAFAALAFSALVSGRFDDSLSLSDKALDIKPDHFSSLNVKKEALLALKEYDDLLDIVRAERQDAPFDQTLVLEEARLLVLQGNGAGARAVVEDFYNLLKDEISEEDAVAAESFLSNEVAYYLGDRHALGRELEAQSPQAGALAYAFADNNWQLAVEKAREVEDSAYQIHLLLYCALTKEGENELAAGQLSLAVERMKQDMSELRDAADFLEGTRSDFDMVPLLAIEPGDKRTILAALGTKFPESKAQFHSLARALNYDLTFPYIFLYNYLGE